MCTGIGFKSTDGINFIGRTMEWALFDTRSSLITYPRNIEFQAKTPTGKNGMKWTSKYGFVAINGLDSDAFLGDATNEHGLNVSMFYHPGFASYAEFKQEKSASTISCNDFIAYCVTNFKNVIELKAGIAKIEIIGIHEDGFGTDDIPLHFIAKDASGRCVTIEFIDHKTKIFENRVQVITNAPTFDWHMINLQNYLHLSKYTNLQPKNVDGMEFNALGAGSGLLGLPGDFTPTSRFVRAFVFSHTARKTYGSDDTATEVFRIFDSFQLPVIKTQDRLEDSEAIRELKSSTAWTTVWDLQNKILYYHTQHNRRIRKFDFSAFDFEHGTINRRKLDTKKEQDFESIAF